jgi:hypothetical protein
MSVTVRELGLRAIEEEGCEVIALQQASLGALEIGAAQGESGKSLNSIRRNRRRGARGLR